jgi:hypothetical protein
MDEEAEDIPLGLTKEQWTDILTELERREVANRKRSATMKAKAAAEKAKRLAQPPSSLDDAWRRHADSCPHPPYSEAATTWFRENRSFDFDGTSWRRERRLQTTNSGNGKSVRSITYFGADCRVVETLNNTNRRNDEARDYGLPD